MILEKGVPFENYFRFADGTVRPICKSCKSRNLSDVYQLAQFIIFQSVVTFQMDLQVIYMFHTKEKGREQHAYSFWVTGIIATIYTHIHTHTPDGELIDLYDKSAYPLPACVQLPFRANRNQSEEKDRFDPRRCALLANAGPVYLNRSNLSNYLNRSNILSE